MSILDQYYVSAGNIIRYVTLQITDGEETFYLVEGWEDIEARLETGEVVLFKSCAMKVSLPAKNSDGTQDLKFSLSNIEGDVSRYLQKVITLNLNAQLFFRVYMEHDLLAPAMPPYWFEVKHGQWNATQADIVAGYFNLLDTAYPRWPYNLNDHPMLRYIT